MKEQADAPAQVSYTDLDRPNPEQPGDVALDESTLNETRQALQANDAEKMTPDEANELSK